MSQSKCNASGWMTAYRLSSRMIGLIGKFLEGMHSAVFMGVIDDAEFQKYDTYPYGEWENAEEVTGDCKGVSGWLGTYMETRVSPQQKVLVVAAGGGGELLKLSGAGCDVDGVEFDQVLFTKTQEVLNEAGSSGERVTLRHSPRYRFEDVADGYDVVIIPRFFLSYVQGRENRVRFLKSCSRLLRKGGVLAFDFFTRPDSRSAPGALVFSMQPPVSNFLRMMRGGSRRRIESGDHLDPQVPLLHHHYNKKGLDAEVDAAGLSIQETGESWFGWCLASDKSPAEITPTAGMPDKSHPPVLEKSY